MPGLKTPAALKLLYTRLRLDFEEAGKTTATPLDVLAMKVPSDSLYETYGWLDAIPGFRKWVGARVVNGLKERVYQIYNEPYESTIGIDRDAFDDGKLTNAQMVVRGMGEAAVKLRTTLLLDLLRNGQSRVCYDGQNFFDTDHPTDIDLGTGTQSNYEASGFALNRANFVTARARLRRFAGADGFPFGAGMDASNLQLVVPTELQETAESIISVDNVAVAGGVQNNTLKNAAKILVVPELTSTPTAWYLFDTSGVLKPLVLQTRTAPRFQVKDMPTEDNMFWNREVLFGGDARMGAGFGAWFKAFKAVG